MYFNEEWDANTTLVASCALWQEDKAAPPKVEFCITFYGHDYRVVVRKDSIDSDSKSILLDGPSELWDSLERKIEGEDWPKLKKAFSEHLKDEEED